MDCSYRSMRRSIFVGPFPILSLQSATPSGEVLLPAAAVVIYIRCLAAAAVWGAAIHRQFPRILLPDTPQRPKFPIR